MASPQQTDLTYAWEKYMDCRLQGADLQVWSSWRDQLRDIYLCADDGDTNIELKERCPERKHEIQDMLSLKM